MSVYYRCKLLALTLIFSALAGATGCNFDGVVWLPDSSGFVYTTPGQLVRYDVSTGKSRVLTTEDMSTILPAVSPDGKRIAIARLPSTREKWSNSSRGILQVIVYDLEGKELQRSPELTWSREWGDTNEGYAELYWGPKDAAAPSGRPLVRAGVAPLATRVRSGSPLMVGGPTL